MAKKKHKYNWRVLLAVVAAIAAVIFIYLQREAIKNSITALKDADSRYILLAVGTFAISVIAAAGVVYNLRLINIVRYSPILLVQTAGLFLGRITPASAGAIGAMIRLLNTQGHSVVQATSVMGAAAISTFFGNVLISTVALIFAARTLDFDNFNVPGFMIILLFIILAVFAGLMLISNVRTKVIGFLKDVINNLKLYSKKKIAVARAILLGATLTFMYGSTMLLVAYSLGVELSLFAAIITISLGSLGVAVTPLPGGAVGAEAAIAATLVQFGVAGDVALAIALVYRAITFWIPLLPGFIASQYALKKEYL